MPPSAEDVEPDSRRIQGMSAEEILNTFYDNNEYKKNKYGWHFKEDLNFYKGKILNYDFLDSNTGKIILAKGTKATQRTINELGKLKKRAQFMLAARFMRLPSDNSFEDTSTDYPDGGMVTAQKQRVDLARANELL